PAFFEEDSEDCTSTCKSPTVKDYVRVLIDAVVRVLPRSEDANINPVTCLRVGNKSVYSFTAVAVEDVSVVIERPNGKRES
ncbi:MAG: hypothetical protein U9Q94_08220, partial [Candidatus Bipolaricaulota bacterium]|nr:hypothetical protein [Candidatus Bipolaricaulota bacterium]